MNSLSAVKIEWITKNLFRTGFADSFSFSSSLISWEGREKGERITSCYTYSDPIYFKLICKFKETRFLALCIIINTLQIIQNFLNNYNKTTYLKKMNPLLCSPFVTNHACQIKSIDLDKDISASLMARKGLL
jgi:hypothetical protein